MNYYIKKPIPIKAFDLQKTKVDDTGKDLVADSTTKNSLVVGITGQECQTKQCII